MLPHAVFLWTILAFLLAAMPARAGKSPFDWARIRLDYARDEKLKGLSRFTERLHGLARRAAGDELVLEFFETNRLYEQARREGSPPAELRERIETLRHNFDRYYIENYYAFYDLLFIDTQGQVLYSIRKEEDLHSNLARDGDTMLGRCIAARPDSEAFVDFHRYAPSREVAAFFVEPLRREGKLVGWVAMQCAINKINALFASTGDLGSSGETFLVNEEGYLLTESYFEGGRSILERHLAEENIRPKFREGRGHRSVIDYRGARALTSFEVFEYLGTRWLVVAKIDRDEVLTRHYAEHRRYYADLLRRRLASEPPPALEPGAFEDSQPSLRIDMDEFLKAEADEQLETWGISSCTGLLAAYPGRFAYLAHVSPRDRLYGGVETDLLGQMTQKIETFDIYPYEKRQLRFVLVAPHLDVLDQVVDRLIAEGYLLSQILVVHRPDARSAALRYACASDRLELRWRFEGDRSEGGLTRVRDLPQLARLVEQALEPES